MSLVNNAATKPAAAAALPTALAALLGGAAAAAAPAEAAPERAKSKVWLNVGVTIPGQVDEQGNPLFVSLPIGIAIDTMKPMNARGNNKKWNELVGAKNWLLDQVQKAGVSLEPGTHLDLSNLTCRLQHTTEQTEGTSGDDNGLITALTGVLGTKS